MAGWLQGQDPIVQKWIEQTEFEAKSGSFTLIPDAAGEVDVVLMGIGQETDIWKWAALPEKLPDGVYRLDASVSEVDTDKVVLGWALGAYRFDRYKKIDRSSATLVWPDDCDRRYIESAATATFFVRDLINTPASDKGPEELAQAGIDLFAKHNGKFNVIVGDDLLRRIIRPCTRSAGPAIVHRDCLTARGVMTVIRKSHSSAKAFASIPVDSILNLHRA